MAVWKYACKTIQGMNLDLKIVGRDGLPLRLTKAVSGSGNVSPTQLMRLTDVFGPVQELQLLDVVEHIAENTVMIPIILRNSDVKKNYDMHQIGIYAEDPDLGEILYIVLQSEGAEEIPSAAEMKDFKLEWYINLSVSNTENIEVMIDETGVLTVEQGDARYVFWTDYEQTVKEIHLTAETDKKMLGDRIEEVRAKAEELLDAHKNDTSNPHKVTKGQVGLGNADNTSDADKPVSTAQQAALDELYQQMTAYTQAKIAALINGAPTSMDTLKEVSDAIAAHKSVMDALDAAIGKKANAAEFDSHVNDTVKHITAAERDKWNNHSHTYASCTTAAGTAAKTVVCTGYKLAMGAEITVKFSVTNTAANTTLNVNGTGAKPIYYRGAAISAGYLAADRTYTFRYNGTQYELVGDINTDTNTTYSNFVKSGSGAKAGLVPAPSTTAGTTKYLREDGTWQTPTNTNNAVTQTASNTNNADYRVLFSATADDTTRTEGARKDADFKYNPSTNTLTAGNVNADTADSTVTFSSGDSANPTGWADIVLVATGEKLSSLARKLSLAVKNLRYLKNLLGSNDLSGIGDGTVTGAINELNTGIDNLYRHSDVIYDGSGTKIPVTSDYVQLVSNINLPKYTFFLFEARTDNAIGDWNSQLMPLVSMLQGVISMVYSAPTANSHFKASFICNGNAISIFVTDSPVTVRIFGIY